VSFVVYDVETTGLNKRFDQILQFGAIRADDDLIPTDRIELRSRLLPNIVPSPKAFRRLSRNSSFEFRATAFNSRSVSDNVLSSGTRKSQATNNGALLAGAGACVAGADIAHQFLLRMRRVCCPRNGPSPSSR
jgi:DNA polymerase III epsilon subunit-like protein